MCGCDESNNPRFDITIGYYNCDKGPRFIRPVWSNGRPAKGPSPSRSLSAAWYRGGRSLSSTRTMSQRRRGSRSPPRAQATTLAARSCARSSSHMDISSSAQTASKAWAIACMCLGSN